MDELSCGLAPIRGVGLNIGILVGLEKDGLATRRADLDQLGDFRFDITDAGRAVLRERAP